MQNKEKELLFQFVSTKYGKALLNKAKQADILDKQILEMSKKINKLEMIIKNHNINLEEQVSEEDEKNTKEFLNSAVSIFYAKKAPQYLFSYTNDIEMRGCYSNNIDDLMKPSKFIYELEDLEEKFYDQ